MAASIFIASMVATTPPDGTVSPGATPSVTTPEKGAAMCFGVVGSAVYGWVTTTVTGVL
jgi:hypothetical protein